MLLSRHVLPEAAEIRHIGQLSVCKWTQCRSPVANFRRINKTVPQAEHRRDGDQPGLIDGLRVWLDGRVDIMSLIIVDVGYERSHCDFVVAGDGKGASEAYS